jgi:hypothetical protein
MNMFSFPLNLARSAQCDVDYKLFLLDSAIAADLRNALFGTKEWNCIKFKPLQQCLSKFPNALSSYFLIVSAIVDKAQPKSVIYDHLHALIKILVTANPAFTSYGFIETYIAEFASESSYDMRARLCRRIFKSDPSNIRALYLCYFYSQFGKGYQYALEGRYRLYNCILDLSKIYASRIVLSPLLGVSIGHYFLLAQAAGSSNIKDRIMMILSRGQIGSELIELFARIFETPINTYSYGQDLSLDTLASCLNADIIAYSCCVNNCKSITHSNDKSQQSVSLHLRTEGYKAQGGSWNLLRNSTPSRFEPLGEYILQSINDVQLIRIHCEGDLKHDDSVWTSHVVNDAESARQQWNFIRDSTLFIGCNSGISSLAPFLAKSTLIVNATSLWSAVAISSDVVFAMKRIIRKQLACEYFFRDDFMSMVYLDWVGNCGLCEFFAIEELSPQELLSAYIQATSQAVVKFSQLCLEVGINVSSDVPERYLTLDCASNIRDISMSLPLRTPGAMPPRLSRIIWQ